jgi:hypothetical protein
MSEFLKRCLIEKVVENLNILNGTEFEYFSLIVMKVLIGGEIIHKGHNLYAKPVKSTVDLYDENYEIIGQAGTDTNYFENLSKPLHDVERATVLSPLCNTIYLFSNRYCSGSQYNNLNQEIKQKPYTQGKTVNVYDSSRISEFLVQNLLNTKVQELIAHYLPVAYEIYKVMPNTGNIPICKGFYYKREEEDDIVEKLSRLDVIQLYGLSGIGKTELSISVANHLKTTFDTVIWLSTDVVENSNLNFQSARILKFDSPVNLVNILGKYKVLVICDNLNNDIERIVKEFRDNNANESKLLITSLQKNLADENSKEISLVSSEIAAQILNQCQQKPEQHHIDIVLEKVKGYPLMLDLIKHSVEVGDFNWDEMVGELSNLHQICDGENQKICKRILGKFQSNFEKELGLIKFVNNTKIHKNFMEAALSKIGVRNLEKRSLIGSLDGQYYVIHKLIFDSIVEIVNFTPYLSQYQDSVVRYLQDHNRIKDMSYYAFIFNHKDVLVRTYNVLDYSDKKKLLMLYALINTTDYWADSDNLLIEIGKFQLGNENYYDVAVFIEDVEIKLTKIKANNPMEYEAEIERSIQQLNEIMQSNNKKKDVNWLLNHHIGKLYFWKNDQANAIKYLETALSIDEKSVSTRLQLARVLLKERRTIQLAKDQIKYVMDRKGEKEVQLTILLSFYELLGKRELKEEREAYIINDNDTFFSIIQMSLYSGFDQPFRVIQSLASGLAYECPECFRTICEQMPFPDNLTSNEKLRFAYAQIQASYYKLLKYQVGTEQKNEKMVEIYNLSEQYFLKSQLDNDYKRKMLLDLYIEAEKFDKANTLINTFSEQGNVFLLQGKCKIFRGLNMLDPALAIITEAIEVEEKNEERQWFLAALYNDKAEVQFLKRENECLITLKKAIEYQQTKRTKDIWSEKLKSWTRELTVGIDR